MDRKLKREFVSVQSGDVTGMIKTIENMSGCEVTQYGETITVVCSTLNGLASLMTLCTIPGEGPATSTLRRISEEIVEFIG